MSISIQTNGTILNQGIKKILDGLSVGISLSMDSIHKEAFEVIRKNANYDRVIEHLQFFRDYTRQKGTLLTFSYCPMQQNWRELPEVIEFANQWEMPVFFNFVETPSECSLSNLSQEALAEIEGYLQGHQFHAVTDLEVQNRQTYLDFTSQIGSWKAQAAKKETAGILAPAKNFAEFIQQIESCLRQKSGLSPAEARTILQEIESKLSWLLDQADALGKRPAAEAKIIAVNPTLVIRSLPGISKEQLLEQFESFVMALR